MQFLAHQIVLVAGSIMTMHQLLTTMLKDILRSSNFTRNVEKRSGTQPCYFWKTINPNPCFPSFYVFDFVLLNAPTTADLPRSEKNPKARDKRLTVKKYLKN